MLMEARLLDERREGKAEGFAEGKDVGLVEGEAMGIANANIATAKRLFSIELSPRLLLSRLHKFKLCKLSRLAYNLFAVK